LAKSSNDLIFGVEINREKNKKEDSNVASFAPPTKDDGAVHISHAGGGVDGLNQAHALSLEVNVSNEAELIEKYRQIALYPECDMAVEEIANQAIVLDGPTDPVTLDLQNIPENLKIPENVQDSIRESFAEVLSLMQFNQRGFELFRRWYIDSRLVLHIMVDKSKKKEGIHSLRMLDPRKIKKIKIIQQENQNGISRYNVDDEYYVYLNKASTYSSTFSGAPFGDAVYGNSLAAPGSAQDLVKISTDAIAFCHSGLVDVNSGIIYGYLQKTVKRFNQLRMMEDAVVVNRLSKANERRIFYVGTANMQPNDAIRYTKNLQNRTRNKITYDVNTGELSDTRKVLALREDMWLPRMGDGRSTEVDTLPAGANFGDIDDLLYFKNELYKTLNIPVSRFKEESINAFLGGGGEISQEELKFSKFVNRVRVQFSSIFHQLLRVQLVLKQVVTEEEWEEFESFIKYDFADDGFWAEARDGEILKNRIDLLSTVQDHIGTMYSMEWVRKNVLRMTDEETKDMQDQIDKEIKDGTINKEDEEEF